MGLRRDRPKEPIITRADSLAEENVRSNPAITKVTHFANFAGGHLVSVSVAKHLPGEECGTHNHRGADEYFFVVAGSGIVTVGDVDYQLNAGDSVLVPVGLMHNLKGVSTEEDGIFEVLCALVVAKGYEWDDEPWKPL